ncbi:rRNA maturation RNase YbeY [Thalassorhabdus alkalitolerans]|uniref:Endoribonuclease YbeY n=1 Tax=Thalassorhabdus alkalitolerans TaxID=2282697 RepID=A0ABW0YPZ4_9BACI
MTYIIDLLDETESLTQEKQELVRRIVESACLQENVPAETEVSVTFVDNQAIQDINREYRGKDYATDVISFALDEGEEGPVDPSVPNLLGDIIISVPKAEEQAAAYGHSFERELGFLAVHGVLHLLGYIHETEEQEKQMISRQEEILKAYGLER